MDRRGPRNVRALAVRVGTVVLGLAVLGVVVLATTAPRPPLTGDGVADIGAPPSVTVAVLVLGAASLVFLLTQLRRHRGPREPVTLARVARAVITILAVAWLLGRLVPPADRDDPTVAADLPATVVETSDPASLHTSTTAVIASLVALGLLGATVLGRRAVTRSRSGSPSPEGRTVSDVGGTSPDPHTIADPRDAVVAAYHAGRNEVARLVRVRDSDGPVTLQRRVAGTPAGPGFAELTTVYLPVRFGRGDREEPDRTRALEALDAVRAAVERALGEVRP